MVVEDIISISGKGTVITGEIINGEINQNYSVAVGDYRYTVAGIEHQRKIIQSATENMNVGILLKDADAKYIQQGEMVRKIKH